MTHQTVPLTPYRFRCLPYRIPVVACNLPQASRTLVEPQPESHA